MVGKNMRSTSVRKDSNIAAIGLIRGVIETVGRRHVHSGEEVSAYFNISRWPPRAWMTAHMILNWSMRPLQRPRLLEWGN